MPIIKQLIALRRKAGMTKDEFFDYHYQVHGALSTGPSPSETPLKYFQTHFLDTAYHPNPAQNIPNAHPAWAFSDGLTELYFSSEDHMVQNFASEWVSKKVGPDGANFSDFSAVMPMFVSEEVVPLASTTSETSTWERAFVAMYFLALRDSQISEEKNGEVIDKFASLLKQHASHDALGLVVNGPTEVGFDLSAYFGGGRWSFPTYYVFMVVLRGKESVGAVRKVQGIFEEEYAGVLDLPATWIGFGERAVVLDQAEGIEFDPKRQPYKMG
ncbi:hypothetical protein CBS147343_8090 [Aspergillus niger]|uniref:Mechanosensitive ion channel family protein n=1 Tax=Aspergillus niger TaxID=5061 RepID=A0A3F3RLY4_ASPNG|nr:hypothetical protein CBS133816_10969 [Aspergillus niger]KAI2865671.1 hypothetical protein CBS12448_1968 [Aspergillus niger]KAI2915919.1 hypothetical protein CBS147320_9754 [Aspergillus niger]KAI2962994.1 hypothetical protein CBS147324_9238 [Aspergillus niger]KAI2968030.1 hypothetical protein CBS147323_4578 [Aspergillus niger]